MQTEAELDVSRHRILIADDETFVRNVTARMLSAIGCQLPVEASNGREALALLEKPGEHIDLVICDLKMPDMDGLEFVRHLAERPTRPAIIFLSGAQSALLRAADSLARAHRLNVCGSLPKPASRAELASLIRNFSTDEEAQAPPKKVSITSDDLKRGIEANELVLHYQPKLNVATKKLDSVEALVRWQHPQYGLLGPYAFVALAESGPLIGPMTRNLVKIGIEQLAAWRDQNFDTRMALNLSPAMLSDVDLPDTFARIAADCALKPEDIIFEITETGVVEREAIYLEIVTRLSMKGFRLAIDDFGTGQSSLQKLEAIPFAELKIDRQFVHGAYRSQAKRAILEASLGLAKAFQLKTVAEGVELGEDFELLEDLGCDVAQGFFMSKPLPPEAVMEWSASRQAKLARTP